MVATIPIDWRRRHIFEGNRLPAMDPLDINQYITMQHAKASDLFTPTSRIGGATLVLAVDKWGQEIVDLGPAMIASTAAAA